MPKVPEQALNKHDVEIQVEPGRSEEDPERD
jgi:hypothetical protein